MLKRSENSTIVWLSGKTAVQKEWKTAFSSEMLLKLLENKFMQLKKVWKALMLAFFLNSEL